MRAYTFSTGLAGLSDFLHSEYDPTYVTSRKKVKAGSGGVRALPQFCILAIVSLGATVTAGALVGTGNGAIGTVTADGSAMAGRWLIYNVEAESDSGRLQVIRPDGTIDGVATVGAAYNGGINFTLADGSTDIGPGSYIPVDVAYEPGSGKLVQWDPTGTDGSQVVAGVNPFYAEAADGVDSDYVPYLARGPLIGRREALVFHDGATTAQKNAAYAALERLGMQLRISG